MLEYSTWMSSPSRSISASRASTVRSSVAGCGLWYKRSAMSSTAELLVRARKVLADSQPDATAVLVRDGRTAAIDRWEELSRAEAAEIIDLGELVLSPGFIDTHVHI